MDFYWSALVTGINGMVRSCMIIHTPKTGIPGTMLCISTQDPSVGGWRFGALRQAPEPIRSYVLDLLLFPRFRNDGAALSEKCRFSVELFFIGFWKHIISIYSLYWTFESACPLASSGWLILTYLRYGSRTVESWKSETFGRSHTSVVFTNLCNVVFGPKY